MDQDREEQKHRLRNRKKSNASKQAWKKHHFNYMRGIRQRERDNLKSSRINLEIGKETYTQISELNKQLSQLLSEASIEQESEIEE